MGVMQLKKWICNLPVFFVMLVACAHPTITASVIPVTQSPLATETNLPNPTEKIATPTEAAVWYSHPIADPAILGKSYGFLNTTGMSIYETLDDAVALSEKFRAAPKPPAYLAYDQIENVGGKDYVHLTDGGWMAKENLSPVTVTTFSGLIISDIPSHPFGWVIRDAIGWTNSSANTSSGLVHKRYQVVSILDQSGGFARLDTNDWLSLNDLALIDLGNITTTPPPSCRWVDVDLTSQTLVVFENCQPIFATLISSAKAPAKTPTGTFTIFYKEEKLPLFANERVSSESFYLADVPWLMFYHENWAIHGAYWHDHFGEPWSHGCINVSPYDARWLYQWLKLGDMIVIHE